MNQILINYKYGFQRVINVSKLFFEDGKLSAFDTKYKKVRIMSPSDKAVDLSYHLDKDPYRVELIKEGKSIFTQVFHQNKPND